MIGSGGVSRIVDVISHPESKLDCGEERMGLTADSDLARIEDL